MHVHDKCTVARGIKSFKCSRCRKQGNNYSNGIDLCVDCRNETNVCDVCGKTLSKISTTINNINILENLIMFYENDFMCGYNGDNKDKLRIVFLELIVAITRYINNFRYCNKPDCCCSPESSIKLIMKNNHIEIYEILGNGDYGIKNFLSNFLSE